MFANEENDTLFLLGLSMRQLQSTYQKTEFGMTLVNVTCKELWLLNVPEKHFNSFSLGHYSIGPRKCVIGNLPSVDSYVHFPSVSVEMCLYTGDAA